MGTYLVTAGTGSVGTAFVKLVAREPGRHTIRVATRNPNGERALLLKAFRPENVEPVAFDVGDAASLRKACEGVTKAFIIAPFSGQLGAWHRPLAEALKAAGTCEHVVKVSVTGASKPKVDPPPMSPPAQHWIGEEFLRGAGLAVTAIRPTIFMQHFIGKSGALYQRGDNKFFLPTGAAKVAFLDCRDIAEMGAALLRLDAANRAPHVGQAYELTGPEGVTAARIAEVLGAVAGKPFSHVDGEAAFVARAKELGLPETVKFIYKDAAEGWFSEVRAADFTRIVGRTPNSFASFAEDYAAWFGGAAEG